MVDEELVKAVNNLDLKALSLEKVEILLRILPDDAEMKAFKQFEMDKKSVDILTDEDKLILNVSTMNGIKF